MRKSSKGNIWHRADGRFCKKSEAVMTIEKTPEEYAERTKKRFKERQDAIKADPLSQDDIAAIFARIDENRKKHR